MKLNKLTLKDKKLFNRYLVFAPHELSAFCFANIYIWRALYDIKWIVIKNTLCIFFHDAMGCFMYLPPLGKERQPQVIRQAFVIMNKLNKNKDISRIENIEQSDLEYYQALGYLSHEKYADYLCLRSDLAFLAGNKFKSQRASVNYFIKHYNFDLRPLKITDKADTLNLFNSWAKQRKAQSCDSFYCGMLEDNHKVIKEALNNYKQLDFEGIVVEVDEKIKAFSFGYRLNHNTFCILYEITDLAIRGLAQFIFRKFSEKLKDYKYINIMDDSGLENLRKAKLSYKPQRLISAYIVTKDA